MGNTLIIPGEVGQASDGYHTFDELYEHRIVLFMALMHSHPGLSWKSWQHSDGSMFDGWCIAGMELPTGPITYHLPSRVWTELRIMERSQAPVWDGHTPADVLTRLRSWLEHLSTS